MNPRRLTLTGYRIDTCRSNIDRVVYVACVAAEVRDEAQRTRDEAVERAVRMQATVARYEATLHALDDEINGAMVEATGETLARLEDLSHTLGDAWCCGEYATGSGQHDDECADGGEG